MLTVRWLLVAASLWFASAHAATWQVDANGELTGVLGVNVGGTLYNVQFVDGTCVALFSGCDELSDFTFTSGLLGLQASQAFIDEVLLDVPQGNFDTDPSLTNGCEVTICSKITSEKC